MPRAAGRYARIRRRCATAARAISAWPAATRANNWCLGRQQRRATLGPSRHARIVDDRAAARDALARGRHDAALDPADETLERVVHVRLQELELREVAAALAVALDVVAVLDFVEAVLGSSARGDHRVAERPRVPVDRQEGVHRALEGNQRPADVAVGRDVADARREME